MRDQVCQRFLGPTEYPRKILRVVHELSRELGLEVLQDFVSIPGAPTTRQEKIHPEPASWWVEVGFSSLGSISLNCCYELFPTR